MWHFAHFSRTFDDFGGSLALFFPYGTSIYSVRAVCVEGEGPETKPELERTPGDQSKVICSEIRHLLKLQKVHVSK